MASFLGVLYFKSDSGLLGLFSPKRIPVIKEQVQIDFRIIKVHHMWAANLFYLHRLMFFFLGIWKPGEISGYSVATILLRKNL